MRFAFVAHDQLRPTSGGNIYDRHLVEGLLGLGDTVQVIAAPAVVPNPQTPRAWVDQLSGCDCLIEDQLLHPALLPVHPLVRAAGLPVIALVHNLTSRQPRQAGDAQVRGIELAYFRSVDALVTVCQQTLADARGCGGEGLPALVAYPGRGPGPALTPDQVVARTCEPGPLRALFVGVVAPHKGVHRLLSVLARLPADAVTLDVAGWMDRDPAYVAQLRATIDRLGLQDRVRLHGGLDRPGLLDLYQRSQVLALASDREAYPLVGLEALGYGLPLLLTDQGGTGELLDRSGLPGSTSPPAPGVLLDPDDVTGWADQLARWHGDRAGLAARARAALDRFQAHLTWAQAASLVRQFAAGIKAPASPGGPPAPV